MEVPLGLNPTGVLLLRLRPEEGLLLVEDYRNRYAALQ